MTARVDQNDLALTVATWRNPQEAEHVARLIWHGFALMGDTTLHTDGPDHVDVLRAWFDYAEAVR